jgi:hypothetical protein
MSSHAPTIGQSTSGERTGGIQPKLIAWLKYVPLSSHGETHWIASDQGSADLARCLIDQDPDNTTAPVNAKAEAPPGRRQVRINAESVGAQGQPGKTKQCRLP